MGWTSGYDLDTKSKARKAAEAEFNGRVVKSGYGADGYLYLSARGSDDSVSLYVVLLESHNGLWAFKTLHESTGPCYRECPKRVLESADPTDDKYALKFRESCREALQLAEWRKGLKVGDPIMFGNRNYKVYLNDKPFMVLSEEGEVYRIPQTRMTGVLPCN